MWLCGGHQYILIILIVAAIALASGSTAATSEHRPPPSSDIPKLFSLYDSGEGLILICIGVNETSNLTWYWRRDGSDVIVPIPDDSDIRTHESKYWMIFRNELKSTSRLEVHGLNPEYNNTDFICKSHGYQEVYPFITRINSTGNKMAIELSALPLQYARHENRFTTVESSPLNQTTSEFLTRNSTEEPQRHHHHHTTTTHPTHHGSYPQIYGPGTHKYVGDHLVLQCTYTSRQSPVQWHLDYPIDHREVYLSTEDLEVSANGKIFFSSTQIIKLSLEHNNSKIICENEEGRSEYVIHLGHKKRLHDRCTQNVDCADKNSECKYTINTELNHGYCSCISNYISHQDSKGLDTCMEPKTYNQRCAYTAQCKDADINGMCQKRRCRCAPGYYYVYDTLRCTIKKSYKGDICYSDANCAFNYGVCRNVSATTKECTCQDGFKPDGVGCKSRHLQNEEHIFRVGFLTATIVLVVLVISLMIFTLKSVRHCYMQRKRNHYREVIMGEHQLSISSRLAKQPPSRADIVTREKVDTPCGPMEFSFTNIQLTPPTERREVKKPEEDKTVCVPETIPFIHMEETSNC